MGTYYIDAIRREQNSHQPTCILKSSLGTKVVPIFISEADAIALLFSIEGISAPRPSSQDFLANFVIETQYEIIKASLSSISNGIVIAELTLSNLEGILTVFDIRPSDMFNLISRLYPGCEIHIDKSVEDQLAVVLEEINDLDDLDLDEFVAFIDSIHPGDFK